MAEMIFPFFFSLAQLFMLGTALIFAVIGFVITFAPWLQQIGAIRVKGRVVGINAVQDKSEDAPRPSKRMPHAGEKYYRVYEYTTPDGVRHEAEGNTGTNLLGSNLPGDYAVLYLRKDDYEGPSEEGYLMFFFGLPFLFAGLFFAWFSVRQIEINPPSIAAAAVLLTWFGWKIAKGIKPRHLWDNRESFLARKKTKRAAKRAAREGRRLSEAELKERIRLYDKGMRAALPFYFLLAAALVAGGAFMGQSQYRFERAALEAPGKVVALETRNEDSVDGDTVYYPVVRFTTEAGQSVKFRSRNGSDPPLYQRGQAVNVLYLPDNPQEARIDMGLLNYGWAGGLGGAGTLFLFLFLRARSGVARRQRL